VTPKEIENLLEELKYELAEAFSTIPEMRTGTHNCRRV